MKILHVISNLGVGGAEVFLENLISAWPHSIDEHVIISFHGGEVAQRISAKGYAVQVLLTDDKKSFFDYLAAVNVLIKCINDHSPRVVISALWLANIIVRVVCFFKKIPSVSILHNNADFLGFFKKIADVFSLILFGERAVAVSSSVKKSYEKTFFWGRFLKNKIVVIQNGVSVERLLAAVNMRHVQKNKQFVFGAVGRLIPSKGFKNLILAFDLFLKKQFPLPEDKELRPILCIVGDGPERGALKELIADLSLEAQVLLCGHQSNVEKMYHGFSSYISSSVSEGQSLALLEAMTVGLPVVVTHACAGELFNEDLDGVVLSSNEVVELALGMIKMYAQYHLYADHAKKRSIFMRAFYSIVRTAQEYSELVRDLLRSL
ncbi:glycosyltransferase [Candidatus Dependentiae bacterium]|nr:glycosyltransferase [Candidatus Dependentiae bacterium]